MYILLNIKDSNKATELITLLIKNGFSAMITGEEMKDVCSECAVRSDVVKDEYFTVKPSSSLPSPIHSNSPSNYSPKALHESRKPKNNKMSPARKKVCSPERSIQAEELFSKSIDVKEEDDDGPILLFNSSDTIHRAGTSQGLVYPCLSTPEPVPLKRKPKRKATEVKEGQRGQNCAICNSFITFGNTTPIANMARHVKLHASRQPFSCSLCFQGFRRKYEVKQHIELTHPPEIQGNDAVIVNHEPELRDEYCSLWAQCFPNAERKDPE